MPSCSFDDCWQEQPCLLHPLVKVAAIQAASVLGDIPGNTQRFTQLIEQAARGGAKIVVLPEAALTGYTSQDFKTNWHAPGRTLKRQFQGLDPESLAQTVDSEMVAHFAQLARRLGIYLSVPFVEKAAPKTPPLLTYSSSTTTTVQPPRIVLPVDSSWKFYNTIVLLGPTGEIRGHYRKVNLWPFVDDCWATAGNSLCVVDTEYGRVGLGICFDVHVIFDLYKPHSLWCLLYSIAWVDGNEEDSKEWFENYLPSKVRGLNAHTIAANWSTDEPQLSWSGQGYSRIYDHDGTILARARAKVGDEILFADLPQGVAAPPIQDLSVDLYRSSKKPWQDSTVRPWEWALLAALQKNDKQAIEKAAADSRVNWDVIVGPVYGQAADTRVLYYSVSSFQLDWALGDSFADLAVRNGRQGAADRFAHFERLSKQGK